MDDIAGVVHRPDGKPEGVVALTHGAGGSREAPLLQAICEEWARRGWVAVRYNLPYRRRRPKGRKKNKRRKKKKGKRKK